MHTNIGGSSALKILDYLKHKKTPQINVRFYFV
jgi:hypothetical protein